jgi:hypothetical protein
LLKKNELEIKVSEVVDYGKMQGDYTPSLEAVVRRKFTAEAARKAGIKASLQEIQKGVDNFRIINGLKKASDTVTWMKANSITPEIMEEYLETSIIISKFKDRLEKKAAKSRYLSRPEIAQTIRNLIYEDWLKKSLK